MKSIIFKNLVRAVYEMKLGTSVACECEGDCELDLSSARNLIEDSIVLGKYHARDNPFTWMMLAAYPDSDRNISRNYLVNNGRSYTTDDKMLFSISTDLANGVYGVFSEELSSNDTFPDIEILEGMFTQKHTVEQQRVTFFSDSDYLYNNRPSVIIGDGVNDIARLDSYKLNIATLGFENFIIGHGSKTDPVVFYDGISDRRSVVMPLKFDQ